MTGAGRPVSVLRRDEDGEIEKRCPKCGEWWPATKEFFYGARSEPGGLHCYCKACTTEWKREHRKTQGAPA